MRDELRTTWRTGVLLRLNKSESLLKIIIRGTNIFKSLILISEHHEC